MGQSFTREEIAKLDSAAEKVKSLLRDYKGQYFIKYQRKLGVEDEDTENAVNLSSLCIGIHVPPEKIDAMKSYLLIDGVDGIDVMIDWIDPERQKDGYYNKTHEEPIEKIPKVPTEKQWGKRSGMNSPKPAPVTQTTFD